MEIGSRIGQFVVRSSLGAGGMGEVWRAEDTRLGREVALKLLPPALATDPERLARFEREARVLASLNHPNIATLYGVETIPSGTGTGADADAEGTTCLVMELVEGEGLDERLARGPLAVDAALAVAGQVADALEAAHEAGVVHRDLKPANIRLRPDGTVKVLDFGLATTWQRDEPAGELSLSPTLTGRATAAGVILGTAAYMAPEQARGRPVDRRADIWAFGVVLWEMLTGRQLFSGETVTDVLAAVLRQAPNLDALPAATPSAVRRLLRRCLTHDPRRRLQWIGDARLELAEDEPAPAEVAVVPERSPRSWWPQLLATLAAVAIVGLLGGRLLRPAPPPPAPPLRFELAPPGGGSYQLGLVNPGPPVLSPDGSRLAFTLREPSSLVRAWVRDLASGESRPVTGTEGAQYLFWSPDGRSLGYVDPTEGMLERVDLADDSVRQLCRAPNGKGGTWNADGVIVFAPDATTSLYRVDAAGGEPRPVTTLGPDVNSHRLPQFLADGNRFLYLARSATDRDRRQVRVGSLDGSVDRGLLYAPAAARVAGDALFVVDGSSLVVRRFDQDTLAVGDVVARITGDVTLLSGTGLGVFDAGERVAVFLSGVRPAQRQLRWRGLDGEDLGAVGEPAELLSVALSPDGTMAVVPTGDPVAGTQDLWLLDTATGLRTRLTADPAEDVGPVWAPAGDRVYFTSDRSGELRPWVVALDGGGAEPVGELPLQVFSVTPDGRWLACSSGNDAESQDIALLAADGASPPRWILSGPFAEQVPTVSPDGRWLAYESDESGELEIYLTTLASPGRHWRVSAHGGRWPRWLGSGRLAWIEASGTLVSATVAGSDGPPRLGAAAAITSTGNVETRWQPYDAPAAGDRILLLEAAVEGGRFPYTALVDWRSLATD